VNSAAPATVALSFLAGFALGSVPFGYIAGRANGRDIRRLGSGNIGFTNVYRTLGAAWAVPVLVLDVAKGMVPVTLASRFGLVPALVGAGAVLGHVFTPWLGFKGGKGVATTIGVSALLCPISLAVGLGIYALVLLFSGFISLSSIALGCSLPVLTAAVYRNVPLTVFTAVVAVIILARHRSNITRLARGTEPRFGLWLKVFRRQ
jgi:acyl phosphate:glycerol-3-phosphate acyltransferase